MSGLEQRLIAHLDAGPFERDDIDEGLVYVLISVHKVESEVKGEGRRVKHVRRRFRED